MKPILTARAHTIAWLLCAILTCLTIDAPHCEVCDGFHVLTASSRPFAHQHVPVAPDTCNGLCACCLLQGITIASPVLNVVTIAAVKALPEWARPALAQTSSVFRPPRKASS